MESDNNLKFKEVIKQLRLKNGLSQSKLAEKLDIAQKSVDRYEKGLQEPTLSVLVSMAQYFGVTTDYLAGHKE